MPHGSHGSSTGRSSTTRKRHLLPDGGGDPGTDRLRPRSVRDGLGVAGERSPAAAASRDLSAPAGFGEKGPSSFVYKVVGRGTALLSGLHAGDPLALTLPLGHGFEFPGEDRSWWWWGGASASPASSRPRRRSMGNGPDFEIFLGARTRDQLPPGEWIPGAPSRAGSICAPTTGRRVSSGPSQRPSGTGSIDGNRRGRRASRSSRAGPRDAERPSRNSPFPSTSGSRCLSKVRWRAVRRLLGCVTGDSDGEKSGYAGSAGKGRVFDAREVVW